MSYLEYYRLGKSIIHIIDNTSFNIAYLYVHFCGIYKIYFNVS